MRDISLLVLSCGANAYRQQNSNHQQYFEFPDLPEDNIRMQLGSELNIDEDSQLQKESR